MYLIRIWFGLCLMFEFKSSVVHYFSWCMWCLCVTVCACFFHLCLSVYVRSCATGRFYVYFYHLFVDLCAGPCCDRVVTSLSIFLLSVCPHRPFVTMHLQVKFCPFFVYECMHASMHGYAFSASFFITLDASTRLYLQPSLLLMPYLWLWKENCEWYFDLKNSNH